MPSFWFSSLWRVFSNWVFTVDSSPFQMVLESCLFLSSSQRWDFSLISPSWFSGSINEVVVPKLWSKPSHKFYQSECFWTLVSTNLIPRRFASWAISIHQPKYLPPYSSSETRIEIGKNYVLHLSTVIVNPSRHCIMSWVSISVDESSFQPCIFSGDQISKDR